jgi:hypothetical protein
MWPREAASNKDLIAGEQSSVVANLPNLGVQLINIVTELCVFCMDLLGLEIYCNKMAPTYQLEPN